MIMTAAFCLALNAEKEARGEGMEGMMMVMQVTINRMHDPRWPDTICDVVYQDRKPNTPHNAQFSWVDDELPDDPTEPTAWRDALFLAMDVLENPSILPGSDATHFHTISSKPYWMHELEFLGRVNNHLFYRE